jgi:hypothetical protein
MIDKRDSQEMIRLAREGKQISRIWEKYPQYEYWDIYHEIYGTGEKSALGVKRMITTRLNKLTTTPKKNQKEIIEEISELIEHMYIRHKESQHKLDDIRAIINK